MRERASKEACSRKIEKMIREGKFLRESIGLSFEDCEIVGEWVYFIEKNINIMCRMDLYEGKVEIIGSVPGENLFSDRLSARIVYWDEKIILVPMKAEKIWFYSLNTGEWRGIERKKMKSHGSGMFQAIEYNGSLFLIGGSYPAMIRMDSDFSGQRLEYVEGPYERVLKKKGDDCVFRTAYALRGNELFLASCVDNGILQINLDTCQFTWHMIGEPAWKYSGIAWDGETFWISPRNGYFPIIRWDGRNKTEIFRFFDNDSAERSRFLGVVANGRQIIFPGGLSGDYTLLLNPDNPHEPEIIRKKYYFFRCLDADRSISQTTDGVFHYSNARTGEKMDVKCELSEKDLLSFFYTLPPDARRPFPNKILMENNIVNIEMLIEMLHSQS